ncbi:hypothetical protein Mal4_05290 [Maioricimonas rarisocia]|uniref:Uncharacterized protein n=1 Tax=Maioricimonas rarisocia TaxID=2528026 RepID=A0A517Z1A0_9PLAN|nr:hypothetical protein [Maioricimonas rarisocia]QDU36245.1 hypothetical protein Mal4_05290 [Maioricimonas rarisocia]
MSLKLALILTATWSVLVVAAGAGLIWYIMEHPIPGARAEDRAAVAGSGLGTLASIGYGAIWIPLAFRIGKQMRERRERAQRER